MTKEQQLKALRTKLEENATNLPLARTVKDVVPPEGNPEAEVMFIGEAAGYHEHLQRRPFVGAAGKLLTHSLREIGMEREDVWISNILKVRPPSNRDPLPKEIEAYRPYLDTEIRIIKPKIIVTLGRFSLAKFIPSVYISRIHGRAYWIKWERRRIIVFPMYHPAAALRSEQVMNTFKEDFAKLATVIETLKNQSETKEVEEGRETDGEKSGNKQLQLI